MSEDCKRYFRENLDKFILLFSLWGLLGFLLHVSHDGSDRELVAFGREITGQVLAALLTLVTVGRRSETPKINDQEKP